MRKIRLHPLFIALCILSLMSGKGLVLGAAVLSVTAHECGHYFSAKRRGYALAGLSLMPYGAVMYAENGLPDHDCPAIALAGPGVNFLFAVLLSAVWWFFPQVYPVTKTLFTINVSIGVFNLLPCYPLDGGRVLLSLVKNKHRCLCFLQIFGFVMGVLTAVLFVVGLFIHPTPYLLFLSVMFFIGAASDVKNESFRLCVSQSFLLRDSDKPVEEKTLYVPSSLSIGRLIRHFDGKYLYRVFVVKEEKEIAYLEGKAIENLFFADKSETLEEYLAQNNLVGV